MEDLAVDKNRNINNTIFISNSGNWQQSLDLFRFNSSAALFRSSSELYRRHYYAIVAAGIDIYGHIDLKELKEAYLAAIPQLGI